MSNKVIVALDFDSREKAISLVEALGPATTFYKVGLQMLVEEGPEIVGTLVDMNKDVFLDLKVHEIPNSVAGAVTAAGKLGVSMVTVHASGGAAVLRSAVTAAAPFPQLKVLALTVITSLSRLLKNQFRKRIVMHQSYRGESPRDSLPGRPSCVRPRGRAFNSHIASLGAPQNGFSTAC